MTKVPVSPTLEAQVPVRRYSAYQYSAEAAGTADHGGAKAAALPCEFLFAQTTQYRYSPLPLLIAQLGHRYLRVHALANTEDREEFRVANLSSICAMQIQRGC